MRVKFLGAAREVTGSCFLVESTACRFLVDCGMVQGSRESDAHNRRPFAFDAAAINFVLLTHAHIDHSGLLPKLTQAGYRGPIYCTGATAELLEVMLPDSAHIQESEAERARRSSRRSRHLRQAATPLYTHEDVRDCLRQLRPVEYDSEFVPHEMVRCRLRDAGHILGSAIVEAWVTEDDRCVKLVSSGDLGQPDRPILRDPTTIDEADVLLIESTYGDRIHKDQRATEDELVRVLQRTLCERRGNVVVPAFAVGRTQEIIYHLHRLSREGRLRDIEVFVDSPMAAAATRITTRHLELFDSTARDLVDWHARGRDIPRLNFTASVEESRALNERRSGAIIISASGMCEAGRIKHHLRYNLPRRECSVLITGFQAQGTLGRRLVDGARTARIFGEEVPVRASIHTVGGLSAHADQAALLKWASAFRREPHRVCVVHGEAGVALAFAEQLRTRLGWGVSVPEYGTSVEWPNGSPRG